MINMKAVHFGAGNIGRGFIGELLYKSNYHVVFIDVNDALIDAINDNGTYNVILAEDRSKKMSVKNISGINSIKNPDQVSNTIKEANLITTAIGKNNFLKIAPILKQSLLNRIETNREPLNIIACENVINGSSELETILYDLLSEEEKQQMKKYVRFVNTTIDRIVPNQNNKHILDVTVEPYFEWIIDKPAIIGDIPNIDGLTYVDELTPYIERKLFTVNTGHATTAYLGKFAGHNTISEAINDENIKKHVIHVLRETGDILIDKYNFDKAEHETYIQRIVERFQNPYIVDEVDRVGREPIRKLSPNDRFINPLKLYKQAFNKAPVYLVDTIAHIFRFDVEQDEESQQLQKMIQQQGIEKTIEEITGISTEDDLNKLITEKYNVLQK